MNKRFIFFDYFLREVGVGFLLSCQFSRELLCLSLPKFYDDVITSWSYLIRDLKGQNKESIIWNNKHIAFEGKSLFFPHLYKAGIVRIKHLFTEDKEIIPFKVWVDKKGRHNM